jgi:hypothetical protein
MTTATRIVLSLMLSAGACGGGAPADEPSIGGGDGKGDGVFRELALGQADRDRIMVKGTTCPFTRAALKAKKFLVGGTVAQPLGRQSDIVALGDLGDGSDLGSVVLATFMSINHNALVGPGGATLKEVPAGTFSIWYPGSSGAHPGHSGILMGDPSNVASGGYNEAKLNDLVDNYSELIGGKRVISMASIGRYIAKNVVNDPNSRFAAAFLSPNVVLDVIRQVGTLFLRRTYVWLRSDTSTAVKTYVQDVLHLVITLDDIGNSAGEYSLLFTRFGDGEDADGYPTVSTDAVVKLFRDGDFPDGWEKRKATAKDWAINTAVIAKNTVMGLPGAVWPF